MSTTTPERVMTPVYAYPGSLAAVPTHYCPGCTHGIAHRLVAEVIDELGVRERTVGVASVGCSVFAYRYFACDFAQAAHGRAPAMASGIKRVDPNSVVFTYQGDGDLASIGAAEILHAAVRGDPITVIFLNNAIYGMTGGQMAPTTLPGQRTTSTPEGRDSATTGRPIRVCEMLATLDGPSYIARTSIHNAAGIRKAGEALRRAFACQLVGAGFSLVEVLAPCPTNWKLQPVDAMKWIGERMVHSYPLGEFKVSPLVASL
jgi:2-oxoglutarate/2-oxoacid ferredoxin oxidoreductase subunit beta